MPGHFTPSVFVHGFHPLTNPPLSRGRLQPALMQQYGPAARKTIKGSLPEGAGSELALKVGLARRALSTLVLMARSLRQGLALTWAEMMTEGAHATNTTYQQTNHRTAKPGAPSSVLPVIFICTITRGTPRPALPAPRRRRRRPGARRIHHPRRAASIPRRRRCPP